jgi:hypothetical protein
MKRQGLAKLRLLLDRQLNANEFRPIEVHLEECASCQTTLQRQRKRLPCRIWVGSYWFFGLFSKMAALIVIL